jgi:hypothetical protein
MQKIADIPADNRSNTLKPCQHIKINGTQCGSPALRDSTHCYYHIRYHWPEFEALPDKHLMRVPLPTLEDANSIQVALANVIERLIMSEIDHKAAALMLYALQTASINLKRTSLEPQLTTQVVIDRKSVADRPIGASAWSRIEGREYDDLTEEAAVEAQPIDKDKKDTQPEKLAFDLLVPSLQKAVVTES